MDAGGVDLADLVVAGDHTAWALEDWAWDHKSMLASAAVGATRASKRRCSGLASVNLYEAEALQLGATQQLQSACCGASFGHTPAAEDAKGHENTRETSAGTTEAAESSKGGPPICQVEGCGRDVSSLSTYFQRCHICEVHIKEPQFMRQGVLQRFCQQCGRCHELSAFQGSKRSCRDQLAKHNARRRRRTDKKAAAQRGEHKSSAGISSSPCQARLADAFASLDASFVEPLPSEGLPDEALPGSAGFSFTAAAYAPASFPVASLAFATDTQLSQSFQTTASEDAAAGRDAHLLHSTGATRSSSPATPAATPVGIQNTSPEGSIALGIPMFGSEHASLAPYPSSFEMASALLGPSGEESPQEDYQSENLPLRLSIKLFNCTPAELPENLKQQLTGWLESTPLGAEGYLRPGCVHLVLQALVKADAVSQMPKEALQALLAHLSSQAEPLWDGKIALVDLNGQLALLKNGQLVAKWDLTAPEKGLSSIGSLPGPLTASVQDSQKPCEASWPSLHSAQPAAVFVGDEGAEVELYGDWIECEDCNVLCRSHGQYHELSSVETTAACCSTDQPVPLKAAGRKSVVIGLSQQLKPGTAWLEAHKGCMLSRSVPILVCPSRALAAELASWAAGKGASGEALLTDIGLLMLEPGEVSEGVKKTALRVADYAAKADLPELLTAVLSRFPAALSASCRPGDMSLLHICIKHGSIRALSSLLQLGLVQVDLPGPAGVTPLHLAALRGNEASAVLLLMHSSSSLWTTSLSADGLSPADFAFKSGHDQLDAAIRSRFALASPAVVDGGIGGEAESDCIVEIMEDSQGEEEEESLPLMPWQEASREGESCRITWPGPLSGAAPWGPAGKWSNITLLGAVACMCTCVVLVKSWV